MPPSKDVDPCDLTHASNMGIAVAYFTVGMTMSFITNPLNIYLVNTLNAEPDLQGTINILQTLPWSLKIIVGFMSDAIPCFGMHRKPYLVAGTAIYGLSWLFYADLEESGGGSLWMLSIVVFVSTMGLIIIDVMADTMTVERSKFEPDVIKGQMQATCYSCRFGGGVLGAVLGTIFTQQDWSIGLSFVQICQLNGYLGILVLPFCVFLKEKYKKSEVPVRILTQLSPSKGAAGDGSGGYGFSAVQVQEDVSLNKAVASSSYQYGYVPAQRRVSNVNELELIEKGQVQAYLTTPIKPTKRFGGFQESAKMGEWGFDASASKRLSGGGGSTVMKALSPFRSKTPRQSASDKGYSRGPQSTNKKNMSKGEAMSEGVDAAQEDTPLIVPNPSSSLKMGGSYTEEQPQPRSSSSGRKALTINTGDDANSESGEPSSGRGSAATNILSPSFHFGASPLVYTLDPAANNSNSNRSGNQAVPSPHIHVLTESDLDMTMESMNTSGSTADYAGMFSPGAIIEGERLQRQEEEEEEEEEATIPVSKQISDIWATVQLKAVWRPMAFVYIFNLLQVPNVAWQSYLQLTLHFESWVLGLSVLFGSIMTFVGILIYKYYLFNVTWKSIYIWSCFLTGAFSLMQLVLIFQINKTYLHMGNYFFSLGDDVITAYIAGIQFLPVCIMYMKLCPDGAEGASYAILTTFGNIALVCANSLGNVVSKIWNVSNTALREGDINGLWRLSLLTSIVPLAPLALLFLLPQTKDEQHALGQSKTRSKIGGACFLIVLAASLAYCINHSMQELLSAYASAGIVNTEPPVYTSHHNDGHRPHHHFA